MKKLNNSLRDPNHLPLQLKAKQSSIESLTPAVFEQTVEGDEEVTDSVEFMLTKSTPEAVLLMKSLVLGLSQIREEYEEFISVALEEV